MSKLSRAVKWILVIWVVALTFAIPQAAQFGVVGHEGATMCHVKRHIMGHSFEVSTFLFFVTPMTLITVLYTLIGLRLRRSSMLKKNSGSFSQKSQQTCASQHPRGSQCRHHTSQSSRRVLKMLVAVVVAFFICWAPFHAQRLYAIYNNGPPTQTMLNVYSIVTYISGVLYYVSATINPILYQIMSLKFREAFKDTLGRCCGLRRGRARRSYSILSRSGQRCGVAGGAGGIGSSPVAHSTDSESGGRAVSLRAKTVSESSCNTPTDLSSVGAESAASQQRALSVLLSSRRGKPTSVVVAPRRPRPRRRSKLWKLVSCAEDAAAEAGVSPQSPGAHEAISMLPVSASANSVSSNPVSNSSLRDVEKGALEDELTSYMEELHRRERC